MPKRDPVEARADRSRDLYDIATWEPRSSLDRVAVGFYRVAVAAGKWLLVLLALLFTVVIGAAGALASPVILGLTLLSAVPALALAVYVYRADITSGEPLTLVVVTFFLAIVFASFAAIVNGVFGGLLGVSAGGQEDSVLALAGSVVFFFLVVGPIEETVKILAVRFFAFRSDRFDAVVDGAVYGAVAGLGFAFVENAIYIQRSAGESLALGAPEQALAQASATTAVRSLAGPGHVVYSAFAGYYLGLAKFNRENAGPIIAKGIIIAALIHATYNSLATVALPGILDALAVPQLVGYFGFVVVFQGFFGYLLYRKIKAYTRAYRDVLSDAERSERIGVDRTEFDG
ncbi:PrsW family intramembrane metalloprotease [Halomarina oriensis]|uniref:PrsW family intramembrane metalloprotease n=1 Tax=Halomarina oriensis TaxID=671145 RepID=A0A6B0GQ99_9EURY|nr:PrsW family glutamic-type intramembrane protease [Halomarina oriensis]MWG35547.1 PrsW family intramembrane metalloprotease [Halomarina oriensis]